MGIMEQQIEKGREWLENLLKLMGIATQVKVEQQVEDDTSLSLWLVIDDSSLTSDQVRTLIGYRGESIDAIQYLANTLINLGLTPELQTGFTVELGGYRLQRQTELKAWVQQVADQVRQTGQEVEMKSLSSAERRQIHTFLKDVEDLATESRGQEPDRRLVVKLR